MPHILSAATVCAIALLQAVAAARATRDADARAHRDWYTS